MFWAGQAFIRYKILPWEFVAYTPTQQGWLQGIMQTEIEHEKEQKAKIDAMRAGSEQIDDDLDDGAGEY